MFWLRFVQKNYKISLIRKNSRMCRSKEKSTRLLQVGALLSESFARTEMVCTNRHDRGFSVSE